jgi:uncharacterized protein YndB with AHSA1/START domain
MSITDVVQDAESLTLTLTAEFDAPVAAVWQMWADPRKLERWWGPPTYPATFVDHDLRVGGRMRYFMTGPDGEKFHGWWEVVSLDDQRAIAWIDGFADDSGEPNDDLPRTNGSVHITDAGDGRTSMVIRSAFASTEDMETLVSMGMIEGFTEAINQIDALLAA